MRMVNLCSGALCLALTIDVSSIAAQSCTATSGRESSLLNVSAGASFVQHAYTVGARLGAAGSRAFGGVRVAGVTYDEDFSNAFIFGADFGWMVPVGATNTWVLCPIVDYAYQAGPNSNDADELIKHDSFHSLSPGVNIGRSIPVNSKFAILPYLGAAVQWVRYERRVLGDRQQTYSRVGVARMGVGVEIRKNLVIRTSLGAPVGTESHPLSFSIGGAFSFAGPHPMYPERRP